MSLFNPNIPQPGDFLSDSQQDLLNNFGQLDTSMGVNHYQFSDNTVNNGKHSVIQMPENSAPITLADELGLYTASESLAPNQTVLFFRQENNGNVFQLTTSKTADFAKFGQPNNPGWTFLPGGLLLQYGTFAGNSGGPGSTTVVFPTPFGDVPYSLVLTINNSGGTNISARVTSVTATGFVSLMNAGANDVYYIAIGRSGS